VEPPGHGKALELTSGPFENGPGSLGVAGAAPAGEHEGLVEVTDGEQGQGALLVEDAAGLAQPFLGLLVAAYLLLVQRDVFNGAVATAGALTAGLPAILKVFGLLGDQHAGAGGT